MKQPVFLILFFVATIINAQQSSVLMKINGKPVNVKEFETMYTKNLDLVQDLTQKDIDNYMQLFTRYKLELEDAYHKKYDTISKLQRELKSYRRDLSKKYLADNDVIDKLVKEAYERMKTDVHVAHILVQVDINAAPEDTLKAYKKIMKIYKKAQAGEDFFKLARENSQDPSAKQNTGDLDYINVFHTVYPFETAAYNTPVGKISKPFRTRFGYHIIKVLDKRPAKGEIEVAHIVTMNKKGQEKDKENDAKTRIFNIYKKLKNKQDTFENLARKFSDDKNSAKHGGKLRKFGIRSMIPPFEKAAFSLKNPGDISEPFQTRYGWHIIKLLKKYPLPAFKQIKSTLKQKVMRDDRSKIGEEKLLKRIEKQFPIKMVGSLDIVKNHVTKAFFDNKWLIPEDKSVDDTFFVINNDEKITYKDFYKYLYGRQAHNPATYNQKDQIIKNFFERFKKDRLFEYYNNHLEQIYPEFAQTMQEYKNGLMLFRIKSDMVWDKSIKDTLGLKKFFETHKTQYKLPKRYHVLMIQTNDKKTAKKIAKDLKKGKSQKDIIEKYKKQNILIKEKDYNAGDEILKKHHLKIAKPDIYKDGKQYVALYLKQIKPEKIPELKEVKGKVINDYQNYLEKQWVNALKKKYPVELNETVWQQLRKKYKK